MWNKILDLIIKIGTPIWGLILGGIILYGSILLGWELLKFIGYVLRYNG